MAFNLERLVDRYLWPVAAFILLLALINLSFLRRRDNIDYGDIENRLDQQVTLINLLRSNSQHLREVCIELHPDAPVGWYPFTEWYQRRMQGL